MNRAAVGRDVRREALVVLDVAGRQVVDVLAFEFGEQVSRHLAERIDQHVQTATVSHADDDFLHAARTAVTHDFVHRRDEALAAFQREALLADVFGVQEALEAFSGASSRFRMCFFFSFEKFGVERIDSSFSLPPALLFRIADVHATRRRSCRNTCRAVP